MVDRPRNEAEKERLAEILGVCFSYPASFIAARYPMVGDENVRVFRRDERVVGGLWRVPMGQWFGGRSVPMIGISLVGVAPEARGTGVAVKLMQKAVQEIHEEGVPLSSLYPATQTLYRLAGYEQGGGRYWVKVDPGRIQVKERGGSIRQATEHDRPAIEALYRQYATHRNGHLDRGEYVWSRVYNFKDEPTTGYVVEENGAVTGYLFLVQQQAARIGYDLLLTDVVATTPVAGRRLWSLLADHRSLVRQVRWSGGVHTPFMMLLDEQPYDIECELFWTMRMTHVGNAFEARGYPEAMRGKVGFQIEDPLCEGNAGAWTLEVEGGSGKAKRGGADDLRLDIRALTPLYTGLMTPWELAEIGWLQGDPAAMETAAAVFAGPAPWMPDMF